ncbi:hypothetical protein ACHAAC_07470 [Aeromicrobium sp. CF4.19]|uniref:hypothetical protein n=1 Tax=Aeromicrobium sp. CF4.19 TaxID=3373082 RepID=UPI003EE6C367
MEEFAPLAMLGVRDLELQVGDLGSHWSASEVAGASSLTLLQLFVEGGDLFVEAGSMAAVVGIGDAHVGLRFHRSGRESSLGFGIMVRDLHELLLLRATVKDGRALRLRLGGWLTGHLR